MINSELALLPDWRFCMIDLGVKGPRYSNWQNSPFLLQNIPPNHNVGVLTGEHSNGVIAVDFDGAFAWSYWEEHIKISIPKTVIWTSGRDARCQMAFNVPQEMWPFIKTFKIVNNDKTEGLEFRWNGCQSVLPPSIHPDTHKPYKWIISPADVYVEDIPLELLEWMINYIPIPKVNEIEVEEVTLENLTLDKLNECELVLQKIKRYEPKLAYDDWIRVTWATVSYLGNEAGLTLMRSLWPEQSKNEYQKLMRGYNHQASPKFGSLIHRAASHNPPKTQRQIIRQAFSPSKQIRNFL